MTAEPPSGGGNFAPRATAFAQTDGLNEVSVRNCFDQRANAGFKYNRTLATGATPRAGLWLELDAGKRPVRIELRLGGPTFLERSN